MKKLWSGCFLMVPTLAMLHQDESTRFLIEYLSDTSKKHEVSVVISLLEKGARVCQVDPIFLRPVIGWAARTGDVAIMRAILGAGKVEVNAADRDGKTSLMLASWLQHVAVVEILLAQRGIAVKVVDRLKRSALYYACSSEDSEEKNRIIDLLCKAGAKLKDGKSTHS